MKKETLHNESNTFLAQWLVGELSDAELKQLVSSADFMAYLKIRQGLVVTEQLNAPVDKSFAKIKEHIAAKPTKVRRLNTNWLIGVAASIAIMFGLFTFLNDSIITVESVYGESKSVVLLDGSEVILNANASVSYSEDNWYEDRKLVLEGEAYFKVAKGEKFTVETQRGDVSVLGTEFNVNVSQNFFDVVCYEGKVGVNTIKSNHILNAKDAVRFVNDNKAQLSQVNTNMPMWIKGESSFKSVPLYQVIKALENQYQVSFDVSTIDTDEIFTGSFPNDSLSVALQTVFRTLNITYHEKEKRNIKLKYKE